MTKQIRNIAIYLPQFHPIPENDEWWEKGFTEWTNVTKAKPRFEGHYQPHLPADLGFYDLRLEEARIAQESMAKEYDIYGFCYYHYWFNGKRLLHEPLDRKLANPKEDLPFMMCWANENWSRAWDGSNNHVLIKQEYSEEDDRSHIRFLLNIFKDERYIRVNGKPVFIFYKPDLFPNMKRTLEIFREEARKEGLELYLCWFERWIGWKAEEHLNEDFDASIEFQPLSKSMRIFKEIKKKNKVSSNNASRLKNKIRSKIKNLLKTQKNIHRPKNDIVDYNKFIEFDLERGNEKYKCYPSVCPMWDNSSRRVNQTAIILNNSTPKLFGKWYRKKKENFTPFSKEENFIFINAWNEWAEGNHLEPDQKWGKSYLEEIKG